MAADEACDNPNEIFAVNHQNYLKVLRCVNQQVEAETPAEAQGAATVGSSGVFTVAIQKDGQTCWLAVDNTEHIFMRQAQLERTLSIERNPPSDKRKYEKSIDYGIE